MDSVVATPHVGLRSQIWTFARHFLEMCVAMCVGGGILDVLLIEAGPARSLYTGRMGHHMAHARPDRRLTDARRATHSD